MRNREEKRGSGWKSSQTYGREEKEDKEEGGEKSRGGNEEKVKYMREMVWFVEMHCVLSIRTDVN